MAVMSSRRALGAMAGLLACLASGAAAAEHARVRLVVEHASGSSACPDERSMRDAIAERLGYDPVDGAGETAVTVRFASERAGIVAHVRYVTDADAAPLVRELKTETTACAEAARLVALTLALVIDPLAATSPPEPSLPLKAASAPLGPSAGPAGAQKPPVARLPTSELWWAVGAGGGVLLGALPSAAPTVILSGDLDGRRFGAELAFEGSLAGEARDPAGIGVRASLLGASVAPCLLVSSARLCPGVFVGTLLGEGRGIAERSSDATPYVAVTARAAFDAALGRRIALRPFASIGAPLTRTTLGFGNVDVWTTPTLTGTLGLALVLRP